MAGECFLEEGVDALLLNRGESGGCFGWGVCGTGTGEEGGRHDDFEKDELIFGDY